MRRVLGWMLRLMKTDCALPRYIQSYWYVVLPVLVLWMKFNPYIRFSRVTYPQHIRNVFERAKFNFPDQTVPHTMSYTSYTENREFYVLSVVANLRSDAVLINGLESSFNGERVHRNYICCFYFENGMVFTDKTRDRHTVNERSSHEWEASQLRCSIPVYKECLNNVILPVAFALKTNYENCWKVDNVITIDYTKKLNRTAFGVIGLHTNMGPEQLIEWIEYQLFYQADIVLLYTHGHLDRQSWDVLDYYSYTGAMKVVNIPLFSAIGR